MASDLVPVPGFRRLVTSQPPAVPAPGGLEQVAGLLLARAAPGERAVHRALLTRWGLDDLDDESLTACQARTKQAYTRLRRIAAATGVPTTLQEAVVLAEGTPEQDLPRALHQHGLSEGRAGLQLVAGLRETYRLPWPSLAVWHRLSPAQQAQWHAALGSLKPLGFTAVPDPLKAEAEQLRHWLWTCGAVLHGDWLVARSPGTRLAALVRRQLATGRVLRIVDLQVGAHRALGATPPFEVVRAWLAHQPDIVSSRQGSGGSSDTTLDDHDSQTGIDTGDYAYQRRRPAVADWSTTEDKILLSCFDISSPQVNARTLIQAGIAAGRTPGSMNVALVRSPLLRSVRRGTYQLPGAAVDTEATP